MAVAGGRRVRGDGVAGRLRGRWREVEEKWGARVERGQGGRGVEKVFGRVGGVARPVVRTVVRRRGGGPRRQPEVQHEDGEDEIRDVARRRGQVGHLRGNLLRRPVRHTPDRGVAVHAAGHPDPVAGHQAGGHGAARVPPEAAGTGLESAALETRLPREVGAHACQPERRLPILEPLRAQNSSR